MPHKFFLESPLKISYDIINSSKFVMRYSLNKVFRDEVVPQINNLYSGDEYFKKLFGGFTLTKLLNSKYFVLQEAADVIIACIIEHVYEGKMSEINTYYCNYKEYTIPDLSRDNVEDIISNIRNNKASLQDICNRAYFERPEIVTSLAELTRSIDDEKKESNSMRKLVETSFGLC